MSIVFIFLNYRIAGFKFELINTRYYFNILWNLIHFKHDFKIKKIGVLIILFYNVQVKMVLYNNII